MPTPADRTIPIPVPVVGTASDFDVRIIVKQDEETGVVTLHVYGSACGYVILRMIPEVLQEVAEGLARAGAQAVGHMYLKRIEGGVDANTK